MQTRFLTVCLAAIAVFLSIVNTARADVFTTFDFTAGNRTHLFGDPQPYSLFGQFSIDTTTGTGYSADFWVQYPGAANGEFQFSNGLFASGNNKIQGFDGTANKIILTFANDLFTVAPGSLDALIQVNFDNNFSVDNSPIGAACIAGSCPDGNAAENPAQLVPEPASLPILGLALLGLAWVRSRIGRSALPV